MNNADAVRDTEAHRRSVARVLVSAQVVLLAALLAVPARPDRRPGPSARVLGDALTAAGMITMAAAGLGLGRGLTASPVPNPAARLRTDGLYGRVRHPIYSALLMSATGRVIVAGGGARTGILVLLVALLTGKARWEEQLLAERFAEYPEYTEVVPRFLPRLRPARR